MIKTSTHPSLFSDSVIYQEFEDAPYVVDEGDALGKHCNNIYTPFFIWLAMYRVSGQLKDEVGENYNKDGKVFEIDRVVAAGAKTYSYSIVEKDTDRLKDVIIKCKGVSWTEEAESVISAEVFEVSIRFFFILSQLCLLLLSGVGG